MLKRAEIAVGASEIHLATWTGFPNGKIVPGLRVRFSRLQIQKTSECSPPHVCPEPAIPLHRKLLTNQNGEIWNCQVDQMLGASGHCIFSPVGLRNKYLQKSAWWAEQHSKGNESGEGLVADTVLNCLDTGLEYLPWPDLAPSPLDRAGDILTFLTRDLLRSRHYISSINRFFFFLSRDTTD